MSIQVFRTALLIMMVKGHLYVVNIRRASRNGVGNRFWDNHADSAIHRVVEAMENPRNISQVMPNLGVLYASKNSRRTISYSCFFDMKRSWNTAVTSWDEIPTDVPVLSHDCALSKKKMIEHDYLAPASTHLQFIDANKPWRMRTCLQLSNNEMCTLVQSISNRSFIYIRHLTPMLTEAYPHCLPAPHLWRRMRAKSNHISWWSNLPMASPYFLDPIKKRYCHTFFPGVRSGREKNATPNCIPPPLSGDSGAPEAGFPQLHQVLHNTIFSQTVRDLRDYILHEIIQSSQYNAVHVRRNDRLRQVWQDRFHFNRSTCTSCESCLYNCQPTNADILNLPYHTFPILMNSSSTTSDHTFSSKITTREQQHRNYHDGSPMKSTSAETRSLNNHLPIWVATDDSHLFSLPDFNESNIFYGINHPKIKALVLQKVQDAQCEMVPMALDLAFLVGADAAIFEYVSTFSAIAYRLRESRGKFFSFW